MTAQSPAETTATPAQRIGWSVLILVTLYICYFSHLGVIGFVGPDEPRYAWIARDMAETGDWVTPRLYGKPWFEKPPLLYWGGAIFFKLFGDRAPETAARLPSAISALLATLALAWLAWRTYGEECARWLLLLLPTSVGMIGFSHAAATDMSFAGMLTIAMVCAAVVLGLTENENTPILPHTPWLMLLLFGFFLGLAVLAKGPAGVILVGGAVFFWAIFAKRWRDAFRLLHPAAVAAFCVTALPWYILCARRNPDFFRVFIIEHNFKRYLTPEFQHIQPFWYYIPILLVTFLPWSAAFVGASILGLRRARENRQLSSLTVFLLCWSLFCLVFFSISRSKLPGYVLPAVPGIALLFVGNGSFLSLKESRLLRYFPSTFAVFLFVAAGAVGFAGPRLAAHGPGLSDFFLILAVLIFLALAVANVFLAHAISVSVTHGTTLRLHIALTVVLPILVLMLSSGRLARTFFYQDPSGKTIAGEIRSSGVSTENLAIDDMSRGMHYGLNFYLRQEIPDWDSSHPRDADLLLNGKNCKAAAGELASCEAEGRYLKNSDRFLYRVRPTTSLNRPGGGRQPQQKE